MSSKTTMFSVEEINNEKVKATLLEIIEILKERGYNPVNQIVGYLISGDPGYISSYKGARGKIITLDRTGVVEVLLKNFINEQ